MAIDQAINDKIIRLEKYIVGTVRDLIVNYATKSNITFPVLSNTQIDGASLISNGKTFLLLGQANMAENGIYTVVNTNPFTFDRVNWFNDFLTINNARIQIKEGAFAGNFFSSIVQPQFIINVSPVEIFDTEPGMENIQANKMDKVQNFLEKNIAIFGKFGQVVDDGFTVDSTSQSVTSSNFTIPTSQVIKRSNIDGGLF
jgi:hypothetical protein